MPVAASDIELPPERKQELGSIILGMEKDSQTPDKIRSVVTFYKQKYAPQKELQVAPVTVPTPTDQPKSDMMTSDISQYTNVKSPSEKQPVSVPSTEVPDYDAAANRTVKNINDHLDKTLGKVNNNATDRAFKDVVQKHKLGEINDEDYNKAESKYLGEVLINKDQRLAEAKDLMNQDPAYRAKVVQKIADDNPKIGKELKADSYLLEAQKRPNNPALVAYNAGQIRQGSMDFSIQHGQLTHNLDFAQSVAAGYHERNKTLDEYDFYNNASDGDAIKHLNDKLSAFNPDKPVDIPGGVGGTIGSQGIMLAKGAGAAAATSLIPGVGAELAPWAAAAATSPEIYKTSYTNNLEKHYADILNNNPNINYQDAYAQAKDKASFDAKADVAAGIAMTVAGGRIGLKGFKPKEFSPGFINIAKNIAHHVAETGVEGGIAGTAAGGAEVLKNIHNEKPIGENVGEAVTGQLLFAYGMAGLTHAAAKLISPKTRQVILQNVAKAPEETVNKTLGDLVSNGKVSTEEANDLHQEINTQRENDLKIPASVKSDDARAKISKMLERRDDLEIRIENQNQAFHPETKEKIKALDEKINETANAGKQHDEGKEIELPFPDAGKKSSVSVIRPEENAEPNIVPLKTENNAIQESSPSSILQHSQEGIGEGGGERVGVESSIQGEKTAEESQAAREEKVKAINDQYDEKVSELIPKEQEVVPTPNLHVGGDETGISHARMDQIAEEYGLPTYEKDPETFALWDKQAKEELAKDPNTINKILSKFERLENPEPWENRAMGMYVADLKARGDAGEFEAVRTLRRIKPILDISGRKLGKGLVSRKGAFTVERMDNPQTLSDFQIQAMEMKGKDNLTPEEKKQVKEDYKNISGKRKKENELKQKGAEELAKKRAEKAFAKAQKEVKKGASKTKEEYAAERRAMIDKYKENKSKDTTKRQGAPISDEDVKLVAKLFTSYIQEGVQTLKEVTAKIYDTVKEHIEGVSLKDIHNMIAGEYDKKPLTHNEIAATKKDIRDEAVLINRLEKLMSGEEPQNPKKAKQRTAAIEELMGKIKAFKKENAEANKFYGESDAHERKIEKMEDELDRLNDLREKAPSEKEKKEISPREQELKDQIKEARKVYNQYSAEGKRRILQAAKTRVEEQTKAINDKAGMGEFAPNAKREPIHEREELKKYNLELFNELQKARDERLKAEEDRDIRLMKDTYEKMPEWEKNLRKAGKVAASGRVLKSAFDVSMPDRQSVIDVIGKLFSLPFDVKGGKIKYDSFKLQKQLGEALGKMYRSAASEKYFRRVMANIKEDPLYRIAQEVGLKIADPHSPLAEAREDIYGPSYAEEIPFLGKPVKFNYKGKEQQIGGLVKSSERNATAFINISKFHTFKNIAEAMLANGKTMENSPSDFIAAADYANLINGRGKIGETAEKWNTLTSKIFFSLRLQASRLKFMTDIVNPRFWAKAPREVKVAYLKDMTKFVATGMAVLYAANAIGFKVGINPYQSDFGKIKIKNTYYDIWGGFGQWATFLSREIGHKTTDAGGHVKELGVGYKPDTRLTVLGRFTRSKLSPEASVITDFFAEKDFSNNPVTIGGEALNFANPLIGSDIWQEAQADHSVTQAIFTAIMAAHGMGIQTYTQRPAPKKKKISE